MELIKRNINHQNQLSTYPQLSLVSLVKFIVNNSDQLALNEFHENRTIFYYRSGNPILFIDYIKRWREDILEKNWFANDPIDIVNYAYDLTLDKFFNLPEESSDTSIPQNKKYNSVKQNGPDCRNYFKAFLKMLNNNIKHQYSTQLDEEWQAAAVMQKLVNRHLYLSLKESIRSSNKTISRYFWSINDSTICLWFPKSMSGSERRKWLEENIEHPDMLKPDDRQNIQAAIYENISMGRIISLDDCTYDDTRAMNKMSNNPSFNEISVKDLTKAVADKKKNSIDRQRPSIKALGEEKLGEIIETIFSDLSKGCYKDIEIARQFNLSKASFSRFAGSHWSEQFEGNGKMMIPDLWRNTAKILASEAAFIEVAKESGVWQKIKQTNYEQ